ncbi:hypothetical protein EZS27_004672 [termite gut metagenome]|uniref:Uncharacterized protein n=1 Tax=termite gut metagenome TaxID=433724 RepID=A0A5J4SPZ9_9ZZZZ
MDKINEYKSLREHREICKRISDIEFEKHIEEMNMKLNVDNQQPLNKVKSSNIIWKLSIK